MAKPFRPHWMIQQQVSAIVARIAPGLPITPSVQWRDEEITWDEECECVGRAPWFCGYFIPAEYRALLLPVLRAAVAPLQSQFDLALTRE